MIKKEDMRVTRTKKLLTDALFALLETTSIEKISVMDVCNKAMVHRATFYKHYEDKYHLFSCALTDLKNEIFRDAHFERFHTADDLYRHLADCGLSYVEEHRSIFADILRNNQSETLSAIMFEVAESSIRELLATSPHNYRIPISVLSYFYAGGLIAVLMWYVSHPEETHASMLTYLNDLVREKNF